VEKCLLDIHRSDSARKTHGFTAPWHPRATVLCVQSRSGGGSAAELDSSIDGGYLSSALISLSPSRVWLPGVRACLLARSPWTIAPALLATNTCRTHSRHPNTPLAHTIAYHSSLRHLQNTAHRELVALLPLIPHSSSSLHKQPGKQTSSQPALARTSQTTLPLHGRSVPSQNTC
jgi:hypothetical protein